MSDLRQIDVDKLEGTSSEGLFGRFECGPCMIKRRRKLIGRTWSEADGTCQ